MSERSGRSRTARQRHEAEIYDARAESALAGLDDAALMLEVGHPPYPNREHVDFLDFIFERLGGLDGKRIMEVGCGSGAITTYLAMKGAHSVGVDVSAGMLAIARKRAEVNRVSDRVELVESPLEEIEEPDCAFDAVIANQVLHHLDLPRAMTTIARLLAPGGRALFAEPVLFLPTWVSSVRYSRAVTRFFPSRRDTPDERSIDLADLDLICSAFARAEVHPYQLTTRVQNFVHLTDAWFSRLNRIDASLLKLPGARRVCRYVVLDLAGGISP